MRAYVLKDNKPTFSFEEVNLPVLEDNEAIVNLGAAAMNHRDVWISKGMYAGLRYPIILGSDGAGWLDGEEVIINPGQGWGRMNLSMERILKSWVYLRMAHLHNRLSLKKNMFIQNQLI